jgi:hypothetical protein
MRRSIIPCICARKRTLPFEDIDTVTAYLYYVLKAGHRNSEEKKILKGRVSL